MESVLGLKAEVQRKRQQQQREAAAAATCLPASKLKLKGGQSSNKNTPAETVSQNKGVAERAARDKEQTEKEKQSQEKVRSVLEQKAALYDRLHGGVSVLEDDALNNSFLVNFQQKIVDGVLETKKKRASQNKEEKKSTGESPDDWVEYTDSLGRTREVRRSEVAALKEQDLYLTDQQDQSQTETAPLTADATDAEVTEKQELYEQHHRDHQRQRWEKQEESNALKQDVHYQDVMFDEARSHGVGFVKLSGDAEERQQQQRFLRELHTSAEAAAVQHRAQQRTKDKSMASRLAKIRQRKRLKRGLPATGLYDQLKTPPASDDEEPENSGKSAVPLLVPDKKIRTQVREWDVGKQILGKMVEPADKDPDAFGRKKNLLGGPMEQEVWVDRQRKIRSDEFAPPSIYEPSCSNNKKYSNKQMPPNNKTQGFYTENRNQHNEDFSTKQYNPSQDQECSFETIVNECDKSSKKNSTINTEINDGIVGQDYKSSSVFRDYRRQANSNSKSAGAAIPPPASFEYYGPSSKNRPRSQLFDSEEKMENAISKGLKRLRDQT